MIKKILFLLVLNIAFVSATKAQENTIRFKISEFADSTLFLANYYGTKLYYADTALADSKGRFEFKKASSLEGGLYALVQNGQHLLDIIVSGEESLDITTSSKDPVGKLDIHSSKENQLFYDYIGFIASQHPIRDSLTKKYKNSSDEVEKKEIAKKLTSLTEQVTKEQWKRIHENEGTFFSKFIQMSMEVRIPDSFRNEDGSYKDKGTAYLWAKAHFFDNIDLTDDRLIRTKNVLHNKFEEFLEKMVPTHPDSIANEIDQLLQIPLETSEIYKYLLHTAVYKYQQSKVMCMDGVFAHLVLKYYKTGKAHWMSDEQLKQIIERAESMESTLCGKSIHNISLADSTGAWHKLYDTPHDYTILVFWDPSCGHCKKEIPKYEKVSLELKDSIHFYGIVKQDNKKWRDFLKKNELTFTNVAVPNNIIEDNTLAYPLIQNGITDAQSLNYQLTYDVYATPKMFLLDKDHKIIAKQMGVDQIKEYFFRLWGLELPEENSDSPESSEEH